MTQQSLVASCLFRLRRSATLLGGLVLLIGLSALTVWTVTRSAALAQSRQAYARGELVSCLEHALDHLQRRPWSREAALLAARCLSRLDYASQAEVYYRRAGRLSLSDSQIRAYGLARGPHPEQAIPAFREILERSPDNVTALRRMAAVLLAQKDTEQLLKLAARLDRIRGGEVVGSMLRGVVYHNQRNHQQAVAAFERVLELDPELGEMPASRSLFWNHFTDDLAASGRIEEAGQYLSMVLENTLDAGLMNRLGETFFLQGNLDSAESCFRQAALLDSTGYAPRWNLAKVALQRRRPEEALPHLNEARPLAPGHYGVLYTLASVYRQLGRTADVQRVQEAIRELRETPAPAPRPVKGAWPRYAL
jgi:tetratricopeptide (TPR) repeat protein